MLIMKTSSAWLSRLFLACTLLLVPCFGCGGTMMTTRGVVTSPDLAIVGHDFKLESGQAFNLPFTLGMWKQGGDDDMPNAHQKWEKKGAEHVKVYVAGRQEPLFGLISFHALPSSATGPATRSFSLRVDPTYFDQATDGRIAVVYELVPLKHGAGHAYAWVLWMSDREF